MDTHQSLRKNNVSCVIKIAFITVHYACFNGKIYLIYRECFSPDNLMGIQKTAIIRLQLLKEWT